MANLGVALIVVILILFGGLGFYEYREAEKAKAAVAFHIPEMPELPTFPTAPKPEEKEIGFPAILESLRGIWDNYKIHIALVSMLIIGGIFAVKSQWEFGLVSILLLTLFYSMIDVFWWWLPLVVGLVVTAVIVRKVM